MSEPIPDQNAKVTSASEWRSKKEQGFLVTLPSSGNVCRVRRTMDIIQMLRTGRIPNPLAGIVKKMMGGEPAGPVMQGMDEKSMSELIKLVNSIITRMMIEPQVEQVPGFEGMGTQDLKEWAGRLSVPVPENPSDEELDALRDDLSFAWKPSEGKISVEDIDFDDRFFLFSVAQGGIADAETFRKQQAQFMAIASGGEGVQPEAKQPVGDNG